MYYYAKKDKSEFGVTLEQLRARINKPDMPPNTTEIGEWVAYTGKHAPRVEWWQYAVEVYPVNGEMTWEIKEIDPEEKLRLEAELLAAAPYRMREERNRQLSNCDWTQLQDAPLTAEKKLAWATYRQALRDITLQEGFPLNVEWPTKPE